jgi:dihydroxyacetone kinase
MFFFGFLRWQVAQELFLSPSPATIFASLKAAEQSYFTTALLLL